MYYFVDKLHPLLSHPIATTEYRYVIDSKHRVSYGMAYELDKDGYMVANLAEDEIIILKLSGIRVQAVCDKDISASLRAYFRTYRCKQCTTL